MDARQHFAEAQTALVKGLVSQNWQVRQTFATEAQAQATLAQVALQAEIAGLTGFEVSPPDKDDPAMQETW